MKRTPRTPRTAAVKGSVYELKLTSPKVVPAKFAEGLEEELNAANKRLKRTREAPRRVLQNEFMAFIRAMTEYHNNRSSNPPRARDAAENIVDDHVRENWRAARQDGDCNRCGAPERVWNGRCQQCLDEPEA